MTALLQRPWRWSRAQPVAAVFAVAAVLLLALTIADGIALRTHLAPAVELFVSDLHRRIWWDLSRQQVLLMAVSVVAAVASYLVLRGRHGSLTARRLALGGAVVWLVGAVVSSGWWGLTGSDGGWFNYAPNAGVVFSAGEPGLDRERIGLVLACVGLVVTAIAIAWSFSRRAEDGSAG